MEKTLKVDDRKRNGRKYLQCNYLSPALCINILYYPSSFSLKNEYGNYLSTFNKRSFLQGTSDIFKLFIIKKVHTCKYR